MTSYFDAIDRQISDCETTEEVITIENAMVAIIERIIADHEFPADHREVIAKTIEKWQISRSERGRQWFEMMRSSRLSTTLHTNFHDLASARIRTRFGYWSDKPDSNIAMMEDDDGS